MSHITVKEHDTVETLRHKLRKASDEAYKTRLKAILLAKKGKKRFEIVEQLTVDPKSVTTWLARYNIGGTALLVSNKGGRPEGNPKWDAALFEALIPSPINPCTPTTVGSFPRKRESRFCGSGFPLARE